MRPHIFGRLRGEPDEAGERHQHQQGNGDADQRQNAGVAKRPVVLRRAVRSIC